MAADLNKRIVVRVTDPQLDWISQMAADEGMDNATFVRVVIDRLSKGRPPLIGMMQAVQYEPIPEEPQRYQSIAPAAPPLSDLGSASLVEVASTLSNKASVTELANSQWGGNGAATPLRRVEREVFNPRPN